jgi:hypothetical protein
VLAVAYEKMTEGFDLADLINAKALLAEMDGSNSQSASLHA